jgi:hypothetical protein
METLINEARLKELLKEAVIEVIEERRAILYEVLAEVIEDIALTRAIMEGESTERVSEDEIFKLLEGKA